MGSKVERKSLVTQAWLGKYTIERRMHGLSRTRMARAGERTKCGLDLKVTLESERVRDQGRCHGQYERKG
jgi:hypothetical protein